MPDFTPNYGWRVPKADGTDYIIPDDVRLPIGSIDAQMKAEENARIALAKSPKGIVPNGYAEIVVSSPQYSGSVVTVVAGFSLANITLVAGRNYEVELFCQPIFTVATDKFAWYIYQNGAQVQSSWVLPPYGASTQHVLILKKKLIAVAGSSGNTFDARLQRTVGTGNQYCYANSQTPSYICVTDIGAP